MYADEFGTITAAREAATFASGEDSEQESQAHDSTDESHGQPDDSATAPTPDSGPSRQALITEIQRLDVPENLVPYASEMDSDGALQIGMVVLTQKYPRRWTLLTSTGNGGLSRQAICTSEFVETWWC